MSEFSFFVGIDGGSREHQVCLLQATGEIAAEFVVAHSGDGVRGLVAALKKFGDPACIAVSLEVPRGPVVEALMEQGFAVFSVNPKQLDRFRDRHTVAGAKDDRRDAFVLADALRTDRHLFRRLTPESAETVELRELSRLHEQLVQELGRQANRLRDQLHRYYPQCLTLSQAADEPWLWDVLEKAPCPEMARSLSHAKVRSILKARHIRRLSAEEIVESLRSTPLHVAAGVVSAARVHVKLTLESLRLTHRQLKDVDHQLQMILAQLPCPESTPGQCREHRDVEILLSLPGIGQIVAATMLAEAAEPLARRDYASLRALAGSAPVTRRSGRSSRTVMRRACNARLRAAVFNWARNAIRCDQRSRVRYDELRGRGHSYARSLRGLVDRLLSVLVAALRDGTLYDPSRFLQTSSILTLPEPAHAP